MRIWARLVAACAAGMVALGLGGCAHRAAIQPFAEGTQDMVRTVRAEIDQTARLCEAPAELRLLLDDASGATGTARADGRALRTACRAIGTSATAFQALTLDTLEQHAATLRALTDDKALALRPRVEATGKQLAALPDPSGGPLLRKETVQALTQLSALMADALTRQTREQALQRLLEADTQLLAIGQSLKGFFRSADNQPSPHALLVQTGAQLRQNVLTDLARFAPAEPLRVAELRRSLPEAPYTARDAQRGGTVPDRMVAVIDRWMALVRQLRAASAAPNPAEWLQAIDRWREQLQDTRQALDAAGL